ncbi:MAG: hypothetical protein HYV59_10910 [Planctomycetes bacterium]|nr:hypothetical protein [Planctomycetota bacterium]
MKKLAAVLVIVIMASIAYAGNNETPKTLAEQFIAAVNAKSKEKQKATIHPQCFTDLSQVQKEYLEETLARDFRKTIPEKRTVKVTKLDGGTLPFGDMVVWPLKPTHRLEIEFSTGENSSSNIIRFIAKDKDQWFFIVPMINKENLKKYEEKKKPQQ